MPREPTASLYSLDSLIREIADKPRQPRTGRKDYHKPGTKKSGAKMLTKWQRRRVIAWDGEGRTLEDGKTHIYNMLTNSRGDILIDRDGIGTIQAFEFLLENNDHLAINVIFGGSYDVNMILGDLRYDDVFRLWTTGHTRWKGYDIRYSHRKKFSIARIKLNHKTGKWQKVSKTFVLWDVLGFYQTNFVQSCKKWLGDSPTLDMIAEMKASRSEFKDEDIEEVLRYNKTENKLLVLLMERLFEAFDTCGIILERYDGAGAGAGALLKREAVAKHKGEWDDDILIAAEYAYGGGRIEAVKVGNQDHGPIYGYDIVSAYPSVAVNLPSLREGTYVKATEWDGSDTALVDVSYHFDYYRDKNGNKRPIPPDKRRKGIYPLWFRDLDGSIYYPPIGRGTYWGAEIRNLYKYYEEGIHFTIHSSWNLQLPYGDERPFAFISDAFRHRRIFKRQGNMAHEALKLCLNSIYGKLAQQAGYRNGRIPTYHQLMWAGMITAAVRAKMFDAAMQDPESVIFFATDGLYTTRPLQLPIGTNLGEWEEYVYAGITVVQAGVYWLKIPEAVRDPDLPADGWDDTPDITWASKYRGFDKESLNRAKIVEAWRKGETEWVAYNTRFIGMGGALNTGIAGFPKVWRRWITSERTLSLIPDTKRWLSYALEDVSKVTCMAEGLCGTIAALPKISLDLVSARYPVLWREATLDKAKEIQDLRIMEEEIEDSYH